jgi:serine/threonine-protein kinase
MSPEPRAGEGLVGSVLQDSYRLTRLVGRGGMGTVYEGTQLRLSKRVAVKLLARDLSSNQEALARFRREAEVTSQLGHPHIVQVFDFGTAPTGEPYLVMEYLEGEDLDQRIRRSRRLPLDITVNIVKQIASALASTHARGIVHRDLKPANILVLEIEGEVDFVKVVDFGISKVRAASLRLTNASALVGTPNYMSPEQARGEIDEIDHRTDQWSLACIAYEMLAGRGPFVGETVHSLLYQVIHQEPPRLTTLVPGLPDDVAKVIARGLAKDKASRFPTINAFSRALVEAAKAPSAPIESSTSGHASVKPAAPPPPSATAAPPLTTLSRTASESIFSLSRLRDRVPATWALVGGVAVVVLLATLILRPRTPRTTRPLPPTTQLAPSPPLPRVQVEQIAPPPPPIVAPAPPVPPTPPTMVAAPRPKRPPVAHDNVPARDGAGDRKQKADKMQSLKESPPNEKTRRDDVGTALPDTSPVPKTNRPSQSPKRRHLIEDL